VIPVDLIGEAIAQWSANVSASRARQGLPPLNGNDGNDAQIAVGQEAIFNELDAPRIIIVPTGLSGFKNEQRMPNPPTLTMADNQPKVLWSANLEFTAYLWGDEWPGDTPKPIWWDFNTSLELFRELAMALYRTASGPSVTLGSPKFEQPSDQERRGRWLVAEFSIKIPITDEPYVTLPYGAHPKVEIDLQTSPVTGEIVIPS
jgi:hypothetical protein